MILRSFRRTFSTKSKAIGASAVANLDSSTYWNPEQPQGDRQATEPYRVLSLVNKSSIDIKVRLNLQEEDEMYVPGGSSLTISRTDGREWNTLAVVNVSSTNTIAANSIYINMGR